MDGRVFRLSRLVLVAWAALGVGGCSWPAEPDVQAPVTTAPVAMRPAATPARQGSVQESPATAPVIEGQLVAAGMLQVRDRFITVEQILGSLRRKKLLEALPKNLPDEVFRARAAEIVTVEIHTALRETLMLAEAETNLRAQSADFDKLVDARVKQAEREMITAAGGSKGRLIHDLEKEGKTLAQELEDHRRQIIIGLYLSKKYASAVAVNRRVLWDYYRGHREEFSRNRPAQVYVIAVPFSALPPPAGDKSASQPGDPAKNSARELIDQAARNAETGEDFPKIAARIAKTIKDHHGDKWDYLDLPDKVYVDVMASAGGLWEMMNPGEFGDKTIARALVGLEAGQTSGVLVAAHSYCIVKLAQAAQIGQLSFEDAQSEIERRIRADAESKFVQAHYTRLLTEFSSVGGQAARQALETLTRILLDRLVAEHRNSRGERG